MDNDFGYVIYWGRDQFGLACIDTFHTEREALATLGDYAKSFPHNTYTLCKVVGVQTATLNALPGS